MVFTDEILNKIIQMGADGYSYSRIAHELNVTFTWLERERKVNDKLNQAISESIQNFKRYYYDMIIEGSKGKNSGVQSKVLDLLKDIDNDGGDNRIEIERV